MKTLRSYREALGLTQEEVANRAHTTQAGYAAIEQRKTKLPRADLRREISRVLGIRHVDFLVAIGELDDWELPGFDAEATPPDPQIAALVHLVRTVQLQKEGRLETLSNILQFWDSQDRRPE